MAVEPGACAAGMGDAALAASRLVAYAVRRGIVEPTDCVWAYNRVLECVGVTGPGAEWGELAASYDLVGCAGATGPDAGQGGLPESYDFERDLAMLADAGVAAGMAEDSATGRDRLMMRLMGAIMPRPSEVAARFDAIVAREGSQAATDWFYRLCCAVDYVRESAIARNVMWNARTRWGDLEITINKSKPEKDPRDIAAAGAAPASEAYPACMLCVQNEGYAGRPAADAHGTHPARQNLRIVPIELGGEAWGFQYSPYAYFNEHCIAMSAQHRPMHVDRAAFECLLDFVDLFPHYFVGSNADLPIVGGSILSHDHFQGGRHEFPMMRADVFGAFVMSAFPQIEACVLRWPLTVLRLRATDRAVLVDAACYVLDAWRAWDAPEVGVCSHDEDGTLHNTVTPICRWCGDADDVRHGADDARNDVRHDADGARHDVNGAEASEEGFGFRHGAYELYLALRCNVTSDEHPLGVFHPHEDKWHIKKENIGLIEVMGLAILPPRLEAELDAGRLTREEIGHVFGAVLEDAGVFKWDEAGRAALARFIGSL